MGVAPLQPPQSKSSWVSPPKLHFLGHFGLCFSVQPGFFQLRQARPRFFFSGLLRSGGACSPAERCWKKGTDRLDAPPPLPRVGFTLTSEHGAGVRFFFQELVKKEELLRVASATTAASFNWPVVQSPRSDSSISPRSMHSISIQALQLLTLPATLC